MPDTFKSCVARIVFAVASGAATGLAQPASLAPIDGFSKIQLTHRYHSEGANTGDFNRDGKPDVVSGPFWYEGPTFKKRHTIFTPKTFPLLGYADQFFAFVLDVDRDGWDDVVSIGLPGAPAYWYENPRPSTSPWTRHLLAGQVGHESPTLADLVGDKRPELACISLGRFGYFIPDPLGATRPWIFHPISSFGGLPVFLHGFGLGDLNGDGRRDCITAYGWFEQPASLVGDPAWRFHLANLGAPAGGAQIHAYDIDGDGDRDVVTSMNAHGYGLSWFENSLVAGVRSFKQHLILPSTPRAAGPVQFSQLHGLTVADMDGDGLLDIITGKTYLAHNGADPGARDPAVVYYFRLQRRGGIRFVPEFLATSTGIGRQVVARDVDGDGRMDVIIGNKLGVAVLRRR